MTGQLIAAAIIFLTAGNLLTSLIDDEAAQRSLDLPLLNNHTLLIPPPSSSDLSYGLEMAFLFPEEANTRNETMKIKFLKDLAKALEAGGVPVTSLESRNTNGASPNQWKLVPERSGFEAVSPITPPFRHIKCLLEIIKDHKCHVDPKLTMMHINIDARGRSLEETGNVYKNALSVEQALDIFHINDPAGEAGKAMKLRAEFSTTREAYETLNMSRSFESLISLGLSSRGRRGPKAWWKRRDRVGLRLSRKGAPKSFEFRGCQSTFDSDLAIAWLNLGRSIVDASYAGTVLEPKERSREESWVSLFNEIVQDKELEGIFVRERQTLLLSTSSN